MSEMTDEELGRKIVACGYGTAPNMYSGFGARARKLLTKPVATRAEIEKWWNEKCGVRTQYKTNLAVDFVFDALSHFSAPAYDPPIRTMSVGEIARAILRAGGTCALEHAREIHRLAQSEPAVDPDAGAKDALWEYWCALPGRNPHASKEMAWREASSEDRSRWSVIAVQRAAEKESRDGE